MDDQEDTPPPDQSGLQRSPTLNQNHSSLMSRTLFSTTDYPLSKLIEDIDLGEIALPDIQRPFVWKTAKVRDLFDSMYRGFPIGYLLFWRYNQGEVRQIGIGDKKNTPRLLVVDGQQRLTSLYAVMKGEPVLDQEYQERELNISFRPADESFEVATAASRKDPEYITDISKVWNGELSRRRYVNEFLDRLSSNREISQEEEDQIADSIDRLEKLKDYRFVALELNENVDEEQVAEVFVRVNSKGEALNQADFILTLMSVFWDEGRREMERFSYCSRRPSNGEASPYNHFIEPDPSQLLRASVGLGFSRARLKYAYAILRGKDLETGEVSAERRVEQFEQLQKAQESVLNLQNWHDFFQALKRAGFRSGDMVTSEMNLMYSYLMYLVGSEQYGLGGHRLREVIARWFFMCNITGRYTGSSESTMEEDLSRVRGLGSSQEFIDVLDRVIQSRLTDDFWAITLPDELDSTSYYSPTLFAYHASLNILDARALFSTLSIGELLDPGVQAKKSAVERHHLFPKNYLQGQGITDNQRINQIANRAYVEWADNIDISDQPPSEYFPKYAERFDEDELEKMMYWHALPERWYEMGYDRFLEERRKLIAQVIRDGFEKLAKGREVLSEAG